MPQEETRVDTRKRSSISRTFKFVEETVLILSNPNSPDLEDTIFSELGLGCAMTLHDLMYRQWFHHLWVVQEVAVTGNPVVICGHHTVSWSSLGRAIGALHQVSAFRLHQLLDGFTARNFRLSTPFFNAVLCYFLRLNKSL